MTRAYLVGIIWLLMQGSWASCGASSDISADRLAYLKQQLFHPDPLKPQPVFQVYSEVASNNSATHFVLYSVKIPSSITSSDSQYSAFLAVLSGKSGSDKLASQLDVTQYITVFSDDVGFVSRMDGCLNAFLGSPLNQNTSQMVHMNIWGILAGSGAISAGSDVVVRLGLDSTVSPVLELKDSSGNQRIGSDMTATVDSTIVIVPDANKIVSSIWLQQNVLDAEQSPPQFTQESVEYDWNGSVYQLKDDIDATVFANVKSTGITLTRSDQIPAVAAP